MKTQTLSIPDVCVLEPEPLYDARGFFFESFHAQYWSDCCGVYHFVQENQSFSYKGVLRGLHYQLDPYAQGKLVRVVCGEIFDVAVDLRKSSPHFGLWVAQVLSAENKKQLWIPPGFAHGFLALSDAECVYKTTSYYSPQSERCIAWNDPTLQIDWPNVDVVLSVKDAHAQAFSSAELFD